ncbi:MAG: hypothetical protein K9J37_20125 [Saprospiraceae bacterium]|nr:hypothetical protein [Saprospiraceae bacterium]MCF8252235.1 hypothetical protein [Saprospiraceae bacterium]MCF8282358.1 hypothetical protein [Bacteroidales bacterium]MCF8313885.1 hypothetical protein [Saprospiraceae bacterium]MCF8442904.1 hypothetical protein [Saprospiraceae bacterium]
MKKYNYAILLICLAFSACTDNKGKSTTDDAVTTAPSDESEATAAPDTESNTAAPDAEKAPFQDKIQTPKGYEVMGDAKGDLDKDNVEEKVVVFNTDRQSDFGTERELHIYKQKDGGWELWHKSLGAVLPSEQGGVMGDPFEAVAIENGSLVLQHFGGSRQKWHYTHRFRYQNNAWQLIGATVNNGAPCDYFEDFDYNLSTGKINYKKTTEDCEKSEENPVTKTEKKDFVVKLASPPNMASFRPGENEVKLPKSDIVFYY